MLECFSQVCDAVSFVHGLKMVHRDIKSRNIFLCRTRGYTQLRGNLGPIYWKRHYDELQGRGDWLTGLGMQLPICPGFNGCPVRRTGRALLGDFGLVRLLESTCDLAHTRVGTPYYLSPEPLGHLGTWAGDGNGGASPIWSDNATMLRSRGGASPQINICKCKPLVNAKCFRTCSDCLLWQSGCG